MRFDGVSSTFLSIISIIVTVVLISLILFYNEYFKSKYLQEIEKLEFREKVKEIAYKLINCLGYDWEEIYYINITKLEEFSKLYEDIEPRCAISTDFDYSVRVIQLEKEIRNYPFQFGGGCGWAWIVNSDDSTVSLVTSDGRELRRHYTSNGNGDPSRTAVDREGNIWVGNRGNSLLVKILFDREKCVGRISEDINENGVVDQNEMVKFEEDGCIILKINLPDCYRGDRGIRAVCIDKDDGVYVGCWDSGIFYKVSKEGKIENKWILPSKPYGCVVGNDGNVYISTASEKLLKLDPKTNIIDSFYVGFTYGIWRCFETDCIAFSTWNFGEAGVFNASDKRVIFKEKCDSGTRGVFIDKKNYIYVISSSSNQICKFDINGNLLKTSKTCGTPTGISMDSCGNLWVGCMDGGVNIFDTNLNLINSFIIKGRHYTYSDFTGFLSNASVEIRVAEERNIKIESKEWVFGMGYPELSPFGLSTIGPKIYYEITESIPVLIKYNETHIIDGILIINAYFGFLEKFYSFLDDICSKNLENFEVVLKFYFDYDVKVFKDKVCSENVCKKLVCNYEISEREFRKGENIIRIKVEDKNLILE